MLSTKILIGLCAMSMILLFMQKDFNGGMGWFCAMIANMTLLSREGRA